MKRTTSALWLLPLLSSIAVLTPNGDTALMANPPQPGPGARHTIDAAELFPRTRRNGEYHETVMNVGTVEERHQTLRLDQGQRVGGRLPAPKPGDFLLIRFVIADDLEGHRYDLAMRFDGRLVHERSGTTRGFGLRSLFVPLGAHAFPTTQRADVSIEIEIENRHEKPFYLESVVWLSDFAAWTSRPTPDNDFVLGFLVGESLKPEHLERLSHVESTPAIRKAISHEIYFASRSEEQLDKLARKTLEVCQRMDLAFLPALCSWWAGTPRVVFERLDFQQICWSEDDNHDEGDALKKLLGEKWDIRYGLTVPNKWSSTPWQTMNHPELNAMRREKTEKAVRILEKRLADITVGYISENEPAYWAFSESDEVYPVRRKTLWADFNPYVVADAARDGVVLDPSDGLDMIERTWLQYNVARYNEDNIEAIHRANPSGEAYSHALLDYNHFPIHGTGHARPYAEAARVNNARTGVEMLWGADMDALWRVREWGAWGCVNREECDGYDIRYHIAILRANFMLGSDMLNSYNWPGMGREGNPVEYFNTLIRDVAGDARVTIAQRTAAAGRIPVREWREMVPKNAAFPWFNILVLDVEPGDSNDPLEIRILRRSDEAVVAFRSLLPREAKTEGPTEIDFGDLAWLQQDDLVALHIRGGEGWTVRGGVEGIDYTLICDMRRERHRSHYVTGRKEGVRTGDIEMSRLPDVRD